MPQTLAISDVTLLHQRLASFQTVARNWRFKVSLLHQELVLLKDRCHSLMAGFTAPWLLVLLCGRFGSAGALWVERATTGQEVVGSILGAALSLLDRCQYNVTVWDRGHGLPALCRVWQHVNLSDVTLGTRPRDSLVAYEDKKPTNQARNMFGRFPPACVHVMPLGVWLPEVVP